MLLEGHTQNDYISVNGTEIEISNWKFDAHIKSLCRKAFRKLSALPSTSQCPA